MAAHWLSLCQAPPAGAPCDCIPEGEQTLGLRRYRQVVMRYDEARRERGIGSAWLRIKIWLSTSYWRKRKVMADLSDLPNHLRRDIGLPASHSYRDLRALRDNGWR